METYKKVRHILKDNFKVFRANFVFAPKPGSLPDESLLNCKVIDQSKLKNIITEGITRYYKTEFFFFLDEFTGSVGLQISV